jgi:hypothetical protein
MLAVANNALLAIRTTRETEICKFLTAILHVQPTAKDSSYFCVVLLVTSFTNMFSVPICSIKIDGEKHSNGCFFYTTIM